MFSYIYTGKIFDSITYRKNVRVDVIHGLVIYKENVRPSDVKGKCSA
jgi:hypothetical protein